MTMKTVKRKCGVCNKMFEIKHDTKTVTSKVCSCKCCVIFYDKLHKKGRKASRETSAMVGRRSMAEVRFDASFIEGKSSVHAHYEISQFEYEVNETCKYTPDWTLIVQPGGHHIYIEFKGVLDRATRKKMKLVKKQHPLLDIRLVFEKASNKIQKGSKTTYAMWAKQWGFPWADNHLPKEWLK
jgi:hypothetical protein